MKDHRVEVGGGEEEAEKEGAGPLNGQGSWRNRHSRQRRSVRPLRGGALQRRNGAWLGGELELKLNFVCLLLLVIAITHDGWPKGW